MGHKASLLLTISRTTKEIIFHPFIIAVLVALIAAMIKLELPIWLDITLDNLKSAAAPCALFSMGVTLARQAFVVVKPILGFALLVKLIIHPLLIAICLIIFDVFDPVWVWTAVLMASLPPAANVYIMARRADQSIQLAGNAVLIGTVISCISVPIVIQFIQYNLML
ncbi:MAG: AEC family transporter [Hyphomicrobiales bacterium]